MNIQTLAQTGVNSFLIEKCDASRMPDGYFYIRKDDAPEWVREIIKETHDNGDMLPDDYKYQFVVDALEALADSDDVDNARSIMHDGVDITTSRLLHWVQSHGYRKAYADDHIQEFSPETLDAILMGGQYMEREEVFQVVLSRIENLIHRVCVI